MHILYPIIMLAFASLMLFIIAKILFKMFPEWNALWKKSEIEVTSDVSDTVSKVNLKEAKKKKEKLNSFVKD